MSVLRGFLWLSLLWLVGDLVVSLGELPLSPGVVGLMLLTVVFVLRGRSHEDVAAAAQPLIMLLAMLIMPGVVGVFWVLDQISGHWLAVGLALTLGTLLSVASTLWLMRRLLPATPSEATTTAQGKTS